MVRKLTALSLALAMTAWIGCSSEDEDSGDPAPAAAGTYQGTIVDAVVKAMLPSYQSTTYAYTLNADLSFDMKANVGFGATVVETGTYAVSGSAITFTPATNKVSDPKTHQMVNSTTLRPAYTGAWTAPTITIAGFKDVGSTTRVIGDLTVTKQ